MFERFTSSAREVVAQAQAEARRLGHPGVGTSHLLLALLAADGPTADVLRERGVTRATAERALAAVLARDPGSAESPRAGAGTAADDAAALAALGIDVTKIREAIEAAFGPGALDRVEVAAAIAADDEHRGLSRFRRRRAPRCPALSEADLLRGRPGARTYLPFGRDTKKALELSLREALRLGDRHIGEEHLLLGLLRGSDSVAVGMLGVLGIDAAGLRRAVEGRRRRSA